MKLPLSLVKNAIKTYVDLKTDDIDSELDRFVFEYKEELKLVSGNISISECNIKSGNIYDLSNALNDLYTKYETWESRLKDLSIENDSIKEMLEISAPILENHVTIMNAELYILHYSDFDYFSSLPIDQPDIKGALPPSVVYSYKNDPNFINASKHTVPFLYEHELIAGKWLCENIFYNNTYVARLTAHTLSDFKPWASYLLNILSKYVGIVYIRNMQLTGEDAAFAEVIKSLLNGEDVNELSLLSLKASHGWSDNDIYQLCVLKPTEQDLKANALGYYCYTLMSSIDYSSALTDNGLIIITAKILPDESYINNFHQKISIFIRENNFRAGFSNTFKGFSELDQFYKEALIALNIGEKNDPYIWSHSFKNYSLEYFKNKICSDITANNLISRDLLILMNYDSEHNTEFTKTLDVYLRELQSPVNTARKLFIQRGTLNYRLKRIIELTGIDFTNYRQMLYLQISFLLIEK